MSRPAVFPWRRPVFERESRGYRLLVRIDPSSEGQDDRATGRTDRRRVVFTTCFPPSGIGSATARQIVNSIAPHGRQSVVEAAGELIDLMRRLRVGDDGQAAEAVIIGLCVADRDLPVLA